jgi:hypothetical protein
VTASSLPGTAPITEAVVETLAGLAAEPVAGSARAASQRLLASRVVAMRTGATSAAVRAFEQARGDRVGPFAPDAALRLGIAAAEGSGPAPGLAAAAAAIVSGAEADITEEALVDAFAIACEIELRIAAALTPSHLLAGWDVTCTAGVVAAAVGACCAARAPRDVLGNAVGIAGSHMLGRPSSGGTMLASFSMGKAAANGYRAHRLARDGFTGPIGIFDAPRGYLHVLVTDPVPGRIADGLGDRWLVTELDLRAADGELGSPRSLLRALGGDR